jgi:hypothetical protein
VVLAYNSVLRRQKQEESKFEASSGYKDTLSQKKKKKKELNLVQSREI